uniref:Uncharacterized protein n=1 Tax=Knipowitschia caucasica TaxID=637954 RepID=A0AAV2JEA9_KNICA
MPKISLFTNVWRLISEEQHDSLPTLSPKRGMISFSVNNSIAKPTIRMQSSVKVTSLVDSVESKKPYGHWIPVRSIYCLKRMRKEVNTFRWETFSLFM